MTWWTYIFPKSVFCTSTPFNNDIRVLEVYGKNKLLVNGSRQSGAYIEKLWKAAFDAFAIQSSSSITSILVLGVAGGTVIHLLRKLYPTATITGVDIDSVMIDIGKKYFGLGKLGVSFVVADAQKFVADYTKRYDFIIVDLFNGRYIPDFVTSSLFLNQLKKLLNRDGRLLINYLRENEYGKKSDVLLLRLKKLFSQVHEKGIFLNRFFWASQ